VGKPGRKLRSLLDHEIKGHSEKEAVRSKESGRENEIRAAAGHSINVLHRAEMLERLRQDDHLPVALRRSRSSPRAASPRQLDLAMIEDSPQSSASRLGLARGSTRSVAG